MDTRRVIMPTITPTTAPKASIKNGPSAASMPPAKSRLNTPVINAGASVLASTAAYDGASHVSKVTACMMTMNDQPMLSNDVMPAR